MPSACRLNNIKFQIVDMYVCVKSIILLRVMLIIFAHFIYIYIYIYFLMSMKNNITQLSDPLVKVARRQLGHSPLVEFAGPL